MPGKRKTIVLVILLVLAFSGVIILGSKGTLLDKVVVERIDLDLSTPQSYEGKILWDAFANKPYANQFFNLSPKNWFANCKRFQARILSLAEAGGFDVESLRVALEGLNIKESDDTARIPVGAFAARKGVDRVWIIVIKWEYVCLDDDADVNDLIHIEMAAFRMKDGKKVGYSRCD